MVTGEIVIMAYASYEDPIWDEPADLGDVSGGPIVVELPGCYQPSPEAQAVVEAQRKMIGAMCRAVDERMLRIIEQVE